MLLKKVILTHCQSELILSASKQNVLGDGGYGRVERVGGGGRMGNQEKEDLLSWRSSGRIDPPTSHSC